VFVECGSVSGLDAAGEMGECVRTLVEKPPSASGPHEARRYWARGRVSFGLKVLENFGLPTTDVRARPVQGRKTDFSVHDTA
jgi:hypothetical protein